MKVQLSLDRVRNLLAIKAHKKLTFAVKRRLSRKQVRKLERAGTLPFLRPVGPRPPERSRKLRVPAPRKEVPGLRAISLGRHGRLTPAEKFDHADDEWAVIAAGGRALRPKLFSQCRRGPCPFVSCSMHLYLDVDPETGAIKINHPGVSPVDLKQPCALRIGRKVTRTGVQTSTKTVGKYMNVTDERIRQTEVEAIVKLRVLMDDDDGRL